MRRADRLFHIVQALGRSRLTTASRLAERLAVSERTIYRDMRDLSAAGVPIEGEAGMGYRLGRGFELPPLMFSVDEVQALVLGMRMVESWGDPELERAARSVLDKVAAVLPPKTRERLTRTALYAFGSRRLGQPARQRLGLLRKAADAGQVVDLTYVDQAGEETRRRVRPIALYFWGKVWTLAAWCDLRQAYRNFRLDRISDASLTGETFAKESPVTVDDYVRSLTHD